MNYLNSTNYDSSQPWGENWADWSSASWGNNWAGTAGGVARQLGLKGRALGEFAKAVNNQKRRLAENAGGGSYGYNPSLELPSWIKNLYQSKGANTGGRVPTGKSGVGRYVNYGGSGPAAARGRGRVRPTRDSARSAGAPRPTSNAREDRPFRLANAPRPTRQSNRRPRPDQSNRRPRPDQSNRRPRPNRRRG